MSARSESGFTIVELMIVVAIVAILATIAYPSYVNYMYRTRRSDGQELLMRIVAAEERYYTNSNTYTTNLTGAAPGGLGLSATSVSGYYLVTNISPTSGGIATGYTVSAAPQGVQAADVCMSLIVDSALNKSFLGTATNGSCW